MRKHVDALLKKKRGELAPDFPVHICLEMPTADAFYLRWNETATSAWNQAALSVVVDRIREVECRSVDAVEEDRLSVAFTTYFTTLRANRKKANRPADQGRDQRERLENSADTRRSAVSLYGIHESLLKCTLTSWSIALLSPHVCVQDILSGSPAEPPSHPSTEGAEL